MSKPKKCPNCGSKKTIKAGITTTRQGKKQRYHCKECGFTFLEKEQ